MRINNESSCQRRDSHIALQQKIRESSLSWEPSENSKDHSMKTTNMPSTNPHHLAHPCLHSCLHSRLHSALNLLVHILANILKPGENQRDFFKKEQKASLFRCSKITFSQIFTYSTEYTLKGKEKANSTCIAPLINPCWFIMSEVRFGGRTYDASQRDSGQQTEGHRYRRYIPTDDCFTRLPFQTKKHKAPLDTCTSSC